MKRSMKLGSLAIIGLFSVSTLAQVAVRPRPTEVRPVEVKPNVTPQVQNLRGKFEGMQTGAATAEQTQTKSCDNQQFATELAAGTKVSYADFRAVVDAKRITNGTCGEGVTKYVPNARENLGEGEVCTLNACPANVASKDCDSKRYDCYAAAFNNDPGAQQVTAAQVKPTIEALRNDCNILQ